MTSFSRPKRWDQPFGEDMTDKEVDRLLSFPAIKAIKKEQFSKRVSLEGILKNDARIMRYKANDIVLREGDYGNSAFLVLNGEVCVALDPVPPETLGRRTEQKKNFWQALSQLWKNSKVPEKRDVSRYGPEALHQKDVGLSAKPIFLQDISAVLDSKKTATLGEGRYFGELAALGRTPRTATLFAKTDTELLEIRWQGLRELIKRDEGWRRQIDEVYRHNALKTHLQATSVFSKLSADDLQSVADATRFETYGEFDWQGSYKKLQAKDALEVLQEEPILAKEGDFPDGVIMVRAGFARVTVKQGNGRKTLTYLGAGDFYGADETYGALKGQKDARMKVSITGLGYVEILRVPPTAIKQHVLRQWDADSWQVRTNTRGLDKLGRMSDHLDRSLADSALLEWAVQERFINGAQTMLIDLDSCTRCDDCVSACAETHDGNPRFIRHGKTFQHWMVANACMHCVDPVCMIGCPTGAIHRSMAGGSVVINDDTCIGCQTCANACPYSNIRMASIRGEDGQLIVDPKNHNPILKATKCDLCSDQVTGPACAYACPHDALKRVDFHQVVFD
jgi:Fe-S-cluster-containing dehydrogenase component/CRP-like cAMP-binding protein